MLFRSTFYRHKLTKLHARVMRSYNPNLTDDTFGFHFSPMMEDIAKELGGTFKKDLTKKGNAKKNTVRIEF